MAQVSKKLLKLLMEENYQGWYTLLKSSPIAAQFITPNATKISARLNEVWPSLDDKVGYSESQVKQWVIPRLQLEILAETREGLEKSLPIHQMDFFLMPELRTEQIREIRLGFVNGLTIERVQVYAVCDLAISEMVEIRWGLKMV